MVRNLRRLKYRRNGEKILINIVITDGGIYRDTVGSIDRIDPYFLIQSAMFCESFQNSINAMSARLTETDLKSLMAGIDPNDEDMEEIDMPICTAVLMAMNRKTEPADQPVYFL